jgi:osmotically-inducible protein OsmY
MDDLTLREQVLDELEFEPSIDAAHIGVSVRDGVVTLTGHVGAYFEKVAAESAVKRVRGVRAIAQDIQVRRPERKKWADDEIAGRAVKILSWDTTIPDGQIMVKVDNGWITLSGGVDWHFQRAAAEAAVTKLGGVVGVSNLINVRAAKASDVKMRVQKALERSAVIEADRIRVKVIGGAVMLDGKVRDWRERAVAEAAAWGVPGVTEVQDALAIE